jgi:hypothetical protein
MDGVRSFGFNETNRSPPFTIIGTIRLKNSGSSGSGRKLPANPLIHTCRNCGEKCIVLQWDLLSGRRDAVRRQGHQSGTPGKTSRCDFVFLWLLSASTCICARSSREGSPCTYFRRHPPADNRIVFTRERFWAEDNHVTVYLESFGLVTRAENDIKSMRYRSMRNRDPREWAEIDR